MPRRGVTGDIGNVNFKDGGKGAQRFQPWAVAVLNALNCPHAEAGKFCQLLLGQGAL